MPGEQFAHSVDELRFRDRELRFRLFLQVFLAVLRIGQLGAKDEVLDLDLAARLFVAPLDDRARRAAFVGVFELSAQIVLGIAEIELGANVHVTQGGYHALIIGNPVPVEYGHHNRTGCTLFAALAEMSERGLQARDSDREAWRGGRLPAKTLHAGQRTVT